MPTNLPEVILRYFERDADRDIESIVGLFAEDAIVIDEREERRGTAEIRAWQTGAASKFTYTTEVTDAEALGPDRYRVTGRQMFIGDSVTITGPGAGLLTLQVSNTANRFNRHFFINISGQGTVNLSGMTLTEIPADGM